ncbi:MAG: S41 family peptidase [Archangium sp.]
MRRRDVLIAAPALLSGCATLGRSGGTLGERDVRVVADALALHPGLHRYLSPAQVSEGLARLDSEWRGATLEARFLSLSRFLSTLRCGHTFCNPTNQSKQVRAALFDRHRALPFTFVWMNGVPVVTGDQGAGLPRGTRVLRIDGVDSKIVLERLLPFTRADGRGEAKRLAQLAVSGNERFEAFDLFHALLFPGAAGEDIELEVARPDGTTTTKVNVNPLTLEQRRAFMQKADDAPRWEWTVDDSGIALLRMPTWALYDTKWDWQKWLSERLDSLASARGFIIDLRENEGGLDCGNPILSRLSDRELRLSSYARRVRFRTTPPSLDPFLDTWDDTFRKLGVDAKDLGDGFFELPREEGVDVLPAVKPKISVKTAVLIGANCSSATFQFAARCQEASLAKLIGQPTGGNRRGINGGSFFFVRLPESGLEFDLPLVGTFPATPQPDSGVEPDVLVTPTVADIASGRDLVLEAARSEVLR